MNFGEKLTSLRKQKGLSQEELGYKLNVTRQTVSKWELGQTTPEMDKLVEMSKIFGVTLDELTNETESNNDVEIIEYKPINDRPQNNSTLKIILLIVAIFVIGGIIAYAVVFSKFLSFGKGIFNKADEGFNAAKSVIDRAIDEANNYYNENNEEYEQMKNQVLVTTDEIKKDKEERKEEFDQMENKVLEMITDTEADMNKGEQEFEQTKNQVLEMINNL